MDRRTILATAFLRVGVALLGGGALTPVEQVDVHLTNSMDDLKMGTGSVNETKLENTRYIPPIVEWDTLSSRAQALYVKSRANGGRYEVPAGDGAPEFTYFTREEQKERRLAEIARISGVVIKRPSNATDLPPADEENTTRYDRMELRRETPEFPSEQHTPIVVMAVSGLLSLCASGYLIFTRTGTQ
jgi:hypothetical protein